MKRVFSPSPTVVDFARAALHRRGWSLEEASARASSIQRLSDFFIAHPEDRTPWNEEWAVDAYLSYYLPLNEIRARAVAREGQAVGFFKGLSHVIDYGAGPATASFALSTEVPTLREFSALEISPVPARLVGEDGPREIRFHSRWSFDLQRAPEKTLFVASYSLTEGALPKEAFAFEALMILEPSTQQDGRALLDLRHRLKEAGYSLWAPCPHQHECPLRADSPRDWCHDRVHVDRPDWLRAIEDRLPFRNETVTMSYLLARKTPAPAAAWSRLVGDRLREKGKDRQMICRGPRREFLAWLHRHGEAPELPRGARVIFSQEPSVTSNELRVPPSEPRILGLSS